MTYAQLSLLDRPPAALPSPRPEDIARSAGLSDCGQYRWWLKRVWRAGPSVCWIMLNPSTADHRVDDPTIRRCINFTAAWGYGGLVVVNLYPFRTPNPAALKRWASWDETEDWHARDRAMDNVYVVAEFAQQADLVIAAWGAGAWDDFWIERVVEEVQITDRPIPLHCIGTTTGGYPKHPLARGVHRVPDGQQPLLWRSA